MTRTRRITVVSIAGALALGSLTAVVHAQPPADDTVAPAFSPVTAERLVNA